MDYISKRIWLYTRIDAPEYTHGFLKRQEKELYDYAKQVDMSVAGTSSYFGDYHDKNRTGLAQAVTAAQDGKFDILLLKSLNRIGRDMELTGELIEKLGELGE